MVFKKAAIVSWHDDVLILNTPYILSKVCQNKKINLPLTKKIRKLIFIKIN
uniref:Uncharacterized protein n=1 Tax=Arundo donax TaxID=35708 RepID=A0A0A9BP52_ARUDO